MFLIRLIYLIGLKEPNLKLDLNDDKIDLKQKEDNEKIVKNSQKDKNVLIR